MKVMAEVFLKLYGAMVVTTKRDAGHSWIAAKSND